MRCAVIGGSSLGNQFTEDQRQDIENIGQWLAENKIELSTGACDGFPYLLGKACVESGGRVIGYSPAANYEEHTNEYKHPIDGCSSFIYLDKNDKSHNSRFLLRSLPLIEEANIVLSLEGNWGTLFELVTAIITGKKIIILKGFGGISDNFRQIYESLKVQSHYDYKESLVFVDSIEELKNVLYTLK
ncbi:hypothetical protein [Peptostreptococcus equinus]|uniref:TIGR00725 family protein n=1 Tax=Peptostreptococcus equinus TaxID=3003601 RepID=A0ABY7JSL9_9FIRM|nr:hypothetical protein [Peptostreptococcus sp. CBA3647]WAW14707.1 hypothetical protein O0R46_08995 [Peptostreptococcus sp. CBA3647]